MKTFFAIVAALLSMARCQSVVCNDETGSKLGHLEEFSSVSSQKQFFAIKFFSAECPSGPLPCGTNQICIPLATNNSTSVCCADLNVVAVCPTTSTSAPAVTSPTSAGATKVQLIMDGLPQKLPFQHASIFWTQWPASPTVLSELNIVTETTTKRSWKCNAQRLADCARANEMFRKL